MGRTCPLLRRYSEDWNCGGHAASYFAWSISNIYRNHMRVPPLVSSAPLHPCRCKRHNQRRGLAGLAHRIENDSGPSEADARRADCNFDVSLECVGCRHTSVPTELGSNLPWSEKLLGGNCSRGILQHRNEGEAGVCVRSHGNRDFCHLHETKSALLHARASRAADDDDRQLMLSRIFKSTCDLLSFGASEGPTDEAEVVGDEDKRDARPPKRAIGIE